MTSVGTDMSLVEADIITVEADMSKADMISVEADNNGAVWHSESGPSFLGAQLGGLGLEGNN